MLHHHHKERNQNMTTSKMWRPKEGDDKDPIMRPCPYCGKRIPNDVVHQLEHGDFPEGFVPCPTYGCSGKIYIYRDNRTHTYSLEWR